jgi:hypothetical protein
MPWTGTTLIAKWRELTGLGSTDDISDVNVLAAINAYYQDDFPLEISLHRILGDWTADATATDDGEYTLADADLDIKKPIMANEFAMTFWHNVDLFFDKHPINANEDYTTLPTLLIGSVDNAAVLNAAFKYKIGDWIYDKASAETALSGDNVPQSTFGAWLLSVDVDGTVLITAADTNATGYATAALAVQGITLPGSTYAIMGFVTAIDTSGAFVPGTTALTGGGVTATFTDGNPQLRNIPVDCCIYSGNLVVRPKPFDQYRITARASLTSPTALQAGTSPSDDKWGDAIATGSALKSLVEIGNITRATEIMGDAEAIGSHAYNLKNLNRKKVRQDSNREAIRTW